MTDTESEVSSCPASRASVARVIASARVWRRSRMRRAGAHGDGPPATSSPPRPRTPETRRARAHAHRHGGHGRPLRSCAAHHQSARTVSRGSLPTPLGRRLRLLRVRAFSTGHARHRQHAPWCSVWSARHFGLSLKLQAALAQSVHRRRREAAKDRSGRQRIREPASMLTGTRVEALLTPPG